VLGGAAAVMELTGLPRVSVPLPWQREHWNRLNRQLQGDRLPHALLLAGLEHSGTEQLALALARLLLCQQPGGGFNCGTCHSCELSASGSHGDFRWLQPEEKSRVIKIEQVRDLVSFITKTASFSARKVAVLAPAESMNLNAANALLKSLEEPGENTYLILVSRQLQGLPATIRSRCQIARLPAPSEDEALSWLQQVTGAAREECQRLLALCDGMPLLAEVIYREPDAEEQLAVGLACRGLVTAKLSAAEAIATLAEAPLETVLAQMATALQSHLRSLDRVALGSGTGRALFGVLDEIGRLSAAVSNGANPNRQLIAEVLAGKVQDLLGVADAGGSIGP